MQAIQVKYLGPTNTKGTRYKAKCASGSFTHDFEYDADHTVNAVRAAKGLIEKLEWVGLLEVASFGTLPSGDYVVTLRKVEKFNRIL